MFSSTQFPRLRFSQILSLIAASASVCYGVSPAAPPPKDSKLEKARIERNYGNLPLSFEANRGQSAPEVKFLSRGSGYSLFLTDTAAILSLAKSGSTRTPSPTAPHASAPKTQPTREADRKIDFIRMELSGASRDAYAAGTDQLSGTANYFLGNDPAQWRTGAPTYAKVRYTGVYPGVDLIYYGNHHQLEYDFVVAPNADPNAIRLHFAGAKKLTLDPNGNLAIAAADGEIALRKPEIYQQANSVRRPVEGRFTLFSDNSVGFTLGVYDHAKPLVIDPVLEYSTLLGGTDGGEAITVDAQVNAYLTGWVSFVNNNGQSTANFPVTKGAFQTTPNDTQIAFVTKFNPTGTALVYSSFLGGTTGSGDIGWGIAVDSEGDAYVTGQTGDTNFPVTKGAFQTKLRGEWNGFVTKVNPTGTALL